MRILFMALALAMAALPALAEELPAPPGPLTLQEVLRLTLARHPAVAAAGSRVRAAEAWAGGAGAQPNPEARLALTAGDPSEDANLLSQRLEIAGQTGLRGAAARAEADAARHSLEAVRREVARLAAASYYGLWETQARREVAADRVELARQLEQTSLRRLQVGEISENAHLRTQLEVARAEADLVQAEGELAAARARLALLLGRPPEDVSLPPGAEGSRPQAPSGGFGELPSLEDLRGRVDGLPEIQALRSSARAARLEAELAGRARAPDLELSAYRSRLLGGPVEQGVQLAVLFPLWDYGRIAAAEGRLREEASARDQDVAARTLERESEFMAARATLLAAAARREVLGAQVERAGRLSEMARRGYEAGLLTLPEVLDTQQAFRLAVLDYVAAEAAVQRARGDLFWSSGGALLEEAP